ncbi:MAG: GNAT family N-acetyltransferase [Rikenellaceae bacterium]|nr:GNAT family N-acetyltransferase [Rikenellaceae bacterium]
MLLRGQNIHLRALEPSDVEPMYRWENDPAVWGVSGTVAPFSREILRAFIEQQQYDIWRTHQLRLVIARNDDATAVGAVDLFDFDPLNRRAGVGVLVADGERGRGYASEALALLVEYARDVLMLNQLYCDIDTDNVTCRALFSGCEFEECGVRRRWRLASDGWRDVVMMQRLF